jgi:hypothetical protein
MALPRVIAICGYKRAGKDTIADFLVDRYGYRKLKIAEGLKTMVKSLFDFADEQLETDAKDIIDNRWNITPRCAMQFFGTDIMQHEIQKIMPEIGRNFWIKKITSTLYSSPMHDKFVISDMRFIHEYEAIKEFQPYIIRVVNPNIKCEDDHCSETEYTCIPYNLEIVNDDSLEALYKKISLNQN